VQKLGGGSACHRNGVGTVSVTIPYVATVGYMDVAKGLLAKVCPPLDQSSSTSIFVIVISHQIKYSIMTLFFFLINNNTVADSAEISQPPKYADPDPRPRGPGQIAPLVGGWGGGGLLFAGQPVRPARGFRRRWRRKSGTPGGAAGRKLTFFGGGFWICAFSFRADPHAETRPTPSVYTRAGYKIREEVDYCSREIYCTLTLVTLGTTVVIDHI
jgi:hypothetical protein